MSSTAYSIKRLNLFVVLHFRRHFSLGVSSARLMGLKVSLHLQVEGFLKAYFINLFIWDLVALTLGACIFLVVILSLTQQVTYCAVVCHPNYKVKQELFIFKMDQLALIQCFIFDFIYFKGFRIIAAFQSVFYSCLKQSFILKPISFISDLVNSCIFFN